MKLREKLVELTNTIENNLKVKIVALQNKLKEKVIALTRLEREYEEYKIDKERTITLMNQNHERILFEKNNLIRNTIHNKHN